MVSVFTIGSVDAVLPGPAKPTSITDFVWFYFAQGYINTDNLGF